LLKIGRVFEFNQFVIHANIPTIRTTKRKQLSLPRHRTKTK